VDLKSPWVGCNILLGAIPLDAKIPLIVDGVALPEKQVRQQYARIRPLEKLKTDQRGWTLDVLNAVRSLGKTEFALNDVYDVESRLAKLHPNTDPKIMMELQKTVQHLVAEIDTDLNKNGLFTLLQWQSESRTLDQEKAEFDRRTKAVEKRKCARFDGHLFLEPQNESELFGLFVAIYSVKPDIFEFEPLDYNTTRGIDIIARNKTSDKVADSKFWYVELKYYLKGSFNHAFKNLRWIVCWDFEKNIRADSEFKSIEETDVTCPACSCTERFSLFDG
jgi:hypothetical protein